MVKTAVILAGGKGTRMGKISQTVPKALLKIAGKPLLEHQLKLLKAYGFKQVLILINHLGDKIEAFCGDGLKFGLSIKCLKETRPMGTAGAVRLARRYLKKDFLVLYGDELVNLDLKRLVKFHERQKKFRKNLIGTLTVHPNNHPFDSDLVEVGEEGIVEKFLSRPHNPKLLFRNLINTPVFILDPKIFNYIPKAKFSNFGPHVFPQVLKAKKALAAYQTSEYIKDVGTPKRLKEAIKDFKSGMFFAQNLNHRRPAIFLDRDGVINKEVGDLRRLKDFVLLPGAAKAIKLINQSGFYAIVVTNQPVVAKGFCSLDELSEIHKKMETLLGRKGAWLDGIYFCPHHPDKGFTGENKKYKIVCECRKPALGLLKEVVKDFNIDLPNSWMVGDSSRDAKTAENAKIKFVGVKTGHAMKDGIFKLKPGFPVVKNLLQAINYIARH